MDSTAQATIAAAEQAYQFGITPIPIADGKKRPAIPQWTRITYDSTEELRQRFQQWQQEGQGNVAALLGEASGNLVDVDLDHPKARRLRDYFLPPTPARSGRAGARGTHYWYLCAEGTTPGSTRQHLMQRSPDGKRGETSVELRTNLSQSVIPPSTHPSGEQYLWEGEPWGGENGPAVVNGQALSARVAMLGLAAVLLDNWPQSGSRHEAYLSLAGGLLRYGDSVHPFWGERAHAAEQLIRALADASHDDDGAETRISESVTTTIDNIQQGRKVRGFPSLAEAIGKEHVDQARVLMAEVEQAAGFVSRQSPSTDAVGNGTSAPTVSVDDDSGKLGESAPIERDPLGERLSTWMPVDLDPYLEGRVKPVEPTVLTRDDGESLMYPGRVNMLYGTSESAKSWIALWTALQTISTGERAIYLDFEDEPVNTLSRVQALGASPDDVKSRLAYVRPEDPLAAMQRDRWGKSASTAIGTENQDLFDRAVEDIDPTLIVADGMSVIFGLHGLNTNDTVDTEVITSWLKNLTRNGRTTVIVIDHTPKGSERGMEPIGSQHKTSMVQGSLIQAFPTTQPVPGGVGEIELIATKDRPGYVRAQSASSGGSKVQVSALVRMDSTQQGVTLFNIFPPPGQNQSGQNQTTSVNLSQVREAEKQQRWREQEEAVKWAFRGKVGNSKSMSDLRSVIDPQQVSGVALNKAVGRLIEQGWVMKTDQDGNPDQFATKNARYELILGCPEYDDPDDPTD